MHSLSWRAPGDLIAVLAVHAISALLFVSPKEQGVALEISEIILRHKVMEIGQELEENHDGLGANLVGMFFPDGMAKKI